MRFVIILGVFCAFLFIGMYIYRGTTARRRFFADMLQFILHLSVEINFSRAKVLSVITRYRGSYGIHLRTLLAVYENLINSRNEITAPAVRDGIWKGLREQEAEQVTEFFVNLGRHNAGEEERKLIASREKFGNLHTVSTKDVKERGELYLKLFIILGIGAVILLL